jgi:hypothetical protein
LSEAPPPEEPPDGIAISDADLHEHFMGRMLQRGVSIQEIQQALNDGWPAADAKPGTLGRTLVFTFGVEWEGQIYAEKEVTVYYKYTSGRLVLLTTRARYGKSFPRG